ncbi:MAG: DNA polymerase II large subunit [Thermoplasmatales archaeon]|nr:DNA polymerase II large subunit [Thermoplasmatales archaeon]
MEEYFRELAEKNGECYAVARRARSRGRDPEVNVEIPQAEDLASRVEKLLDGYGVEGIAEVIRKLTKEHNNREVVSLLVAREMAKKKDDESIEKAIDRAVRAGLAVLTEGILVAPLEGIADTKLKTNSDGSTYVDLLFAGPIRAAGGTGQAMSVLIADVVRRELGIGKYVPTEEEIERFHEEIDLYKQAQHLQYLPTKEEIRLIVGNCPVCIDGEGTERIEISGYRDLPRIETNRVRGGAVLVLAEGLCQKATKIQRHVRALGLEGWDFIDEYVRMRGFGEGDESGERVLAPSSGYLADIVAGRPIFGHPSKVGGFRLRYGRARTCGLAALAFSPASMYLLDEFPALGTQVKTERPGKACVVTPCDTIEGPIVLLRNGSVVQCNTVEEALEAKPNVREIIDCGEILVPFGEFCENNHFLVPCGYPLEWHKLELERKGGLPDDWENPTWERALEMSAEMGVPLHPAHNLFWSDVPVERLSSLRDYLLANAKYDGTLRMPKDPAQKRTLEDLGAIHVVKDGDIIIDRYAKPILGCLGLAPGTAGVVEARPFTGEDSLSAVGSALGAEVRARAMTRIGARMARPEKAKERKGPPVVHGLFPVSNEPGYRKEINKAISESNLKSNLRVRGEPLITLEVGRRRCPGCGAATFRTWCRDCGDHTRFETSGSGFDRTTMDVNLSSELADAVSNLGMPAPNEIRVLDNLPSKDRTPEPLEKAILRAAHGLAVYRDGTIRYDMTDIPLTHFRPREIGLTVDKARELGYVKDIDGAPLESADQMCELKVQDFVANENCGDYMVTVAAFIDDLLEKFYGLDRYYNVKTREDLIGHLGIGLAPHTSGGILCRIIGYTATNGGYAHPFFHASKRRNCDGDEDSIILLLDGLINFSRSYLPDRRGGLMDAPLVLTTKLDPDEIDKEAHNIDCLRAYPIELYEAAMNMGETKPLEKLMDMVGGRIGTPAQYEGLGFTHDTAEISEGPKRSAYSTLDTMLDKMKAQLELGKKIRAVDERDVATRVINKHFLPDMAGNLRSFSAQDVRCTKCETKYRRIPLTGFCRCGNGLTLTVHEASVKKYLEVSKEIAEKYGLSDYLRDRIDILEMSMDSLFNSDKVRMSKLTDFF